MHGAASLLAPLLLLAALMAAPHATGAAPVEAIVIGAGVAGLKVSRKSGHGCLSCHQRAIAHPRTG
jgi:hypothetical protein